MNELATELDRLKRLIDEASVSPDTLEMADESLKRIKKLYRQFRSKVKRREMIRAELDKYFDQEAMSWGHIYHGLGPLLADYYGFSAYCGNCNQEISLGGAVAQGGKCPECGGQEVDFRRKPQDPSADEGGN